MLLCPHRQTVALKFRHDDAVVRLCQCRNRWRLTITPTARNTPESTATDQLRTAMPNGFENRAMLTNNPQQLISDVHRRSKEILAKRIALAVRRPAPTKSLQKQLKNERRH